MEHVDIEMQGVRVRVSSNFEPLPRYLRTHLPDHIVTNGSVSAHVNPRTSQPDIKVDVHWIDAAQATSDALAFDGQDALDQIGKRHLIGSDTMVWTDTVRVKDLAFRFRVDGGRLSVEAAYLYQPRADKIARNPHYLEHRLFGLTRWFVFHPLAWYLEHYRGLYLLHASGIETCGRAVVIAGVGGVGKTTTSVALIAQGARLISENLVFHDAENVYSCYEPIRLDARSVQLLDERLPLVRANIPDGTKEKSMFHVVREAVAEVVPAGWIFLPRFTTDAFVRDMDVDECVERLVAFNELTREIGDYAWFAATLNLNWSKKHSLERRAETLRRFVCRMERYEIGIDRTRGIEPVLDAIIERTRIRGSTA